METWHYLGIGFIVFLAVLLIALERGLFHDRRLIVGGLLAMLLVGMVAIFIVTFRTYDWTNSEMAPVKSDNQDDAASGSGGGGGGNSEAGAGRGGGGSNTGAGAANSKAPSEEDVAKAKQKAADDLARAGLQHFKDCSVCPEMVMVPNGRFIMGSPPNEPGHQSHEGPQVYITFKKPFAISRMEITRRLYDIFLAETGYEPNATCTGARKGRKDLSYGDPGFSQSPGHPAVCLAFRDAKAYTGWLTEKTGKLYRLPSAAEWEYAARASTETAYHTGSGIGPLRANFSPSGSPSNGTRPAGSFTANLYDLHDVHGNAAEWVQDCWHDDLNVAPSNGVALSVGFRCSERIVKGGSWHDPETAIRSASRWKVPEKHTDNRIGFRVARDK